MERLTPLSKLTVPEDVSVHLINETTVAFRERYRANVNLTTSVESSRDSYSFSVLPNLPSELDVAGSYLIVKMKVMKGDKGDQEYTKSDQVSCCQALGVFAFETCKVREICRFEEFDNGLRK